MLLMWALSLSACQSQSDQRDASAAIASGLEKLTWEQVAQLGPHLYETSLVLKSSGGSERAEADRARTEKQVLQWDGWEQYHYAIQKGKLTPLDVTVWQNRVFQRMPDGRIRQRENPEEIHYYLRQTWNPWQGVIQPFRGMATYSLEQLDELEGRPVERYKLGFEARVAPTGAGPEATRRSLVGESLAGQVLLDKTTRVPLLIELEGAWRQGRFARRPGDAGEETRYEVTFKLRRSRFGKTQLSEPPETVARP